MNTKSHAKAGKAMKKLPREILRDLRGRSGLTSTEIARRMGHKSTNGYSRYEYESQGDKPIPYAAIRKLLPLFVGRGSPPIQQEELLAISETRAMSVEAPGAEPTAPRLHIVRTDAGLTIRMKVEPGNFRDVAAIATREFGNSNLLPSIEYDSTAQFAAIVVDDNGRTVEVLHCVNLEQVPSNARHGRRAVCMVERPEVTGLAEVSMLAFDDQGHIPKGTPVGVVVGAYRKE